MKQPYKPRNEQKLYPHPMQALSQGYLIIQEPQKRTIKRPSFHDELENYSKTGN